MKLEGKDQTVHSQLLCVIFFERTKSERGKNCGGIEGQCYTPFAETLGRARLSAACIEKWTGVGSWQAGDPLYTLRSPLGNNVVWLLCAISGLGIGAAFMACAI